MACSAPEESALCMNGVLEREWLAWLRFLDVSSTTLLAASFTWLRNPPKPFFAGATVLPFDDVPDSAQQMRFAFAA